MTIDTESREQIARYYIVCKNTGAIVYEREMMATSAMSAPTASHFAKPNPPKNSGIQSSTGSDGSPDSRELSARLTQIHLKERHEQQIPRRQPTIVCEDIADDIDIDDEDDDEYSIDAVTDGTEQIGGAVGGHTGVVRSASNVSLTVPQSSVEGEDEKRRPPMPTDDDMMVESN